MPAQVNRASIALAPKLYGPSLYDTRGKTTRRKVERVRESDVSIPRQVADRLKYLTMAADVFLWMAYLSC